MIRHAIKFIPFLFVLTACNSIPERPAQPYGSKQPVNTLSTTEKLAHQAGYVVVGDERDNDKRRRQALSGIMKEKRQLFRNIPTSEFAYIAGAELVERTVNVPFEYASTEFRPTPEQRFHLRLLFSVADRVEVRGRTDGRGNRQADERIALRRAESAKRYLLSNGVPAELISINYQAAGDYVADNKTAVGRSKNRRVELEFYIDDFSLNRPMEYVANEVNKCRQPVSIDEWQIIGSDNCIDTWGKR